MTNGLAALLLGVYLVAVALKGNGRALAGRINEDAGFVPWAIVSVLLWSLYQSVRGKPGAAGLVGSLLALTLVAFFLQAGSDFFKNFDNIIAKLKGG